jgi:hypothetical protein
MAGISARFGARFRDAIPTSRRKQWDAGLFL